MVQTRIVETDPDPIYLRYKEIQGKEIKERTLDRETEVRNVLDVIKGLDRQTKPSSLETDLDLDDNPEMWLKHLLDNYPEPPEIFDSSLINNFCDSFYTSARQPGKYAVLVVAANSVIICHTDSKEKTITTDADVFERLLDTDNVDKYARFKQERDGINAYHFERNQNTKSFSEWLGIQQDEIAFEEAGDVKIFCKQKGATSIFQYPRNKFVENFLLDESHTLVSDILRFPDGEEFPVDQVKLGRRSFDTVDEFIQTFYNIYYDLQTYRTKYGNLTEGWDGWQEDIIDYESKVTKGVNGDVILKKKHERFNIVFGDKLIDLSAGWRLELLSAFIEGEDTRLYHAGSNFTKEPVSIGPFLMHNEAKDKDIDRLNDLYDIVSNFDTGDTMSNIVSFVIFDTVAEWFEGPESHFFHQLSGKCVENLDAEGVVVPEEGDTIEYKSRDWFIGVDNDELAQRITKEIQNGTTLLIGGIEDEQQMNPLARRRFDPDNDDIRERLLDRNGNHSTINFSTLPIREDECLALVFSIKDDTNVDFGFLEESQ